jgi:hypothetical protein
MGLVLMGSAKLARKLATPPCLPSGSQATGFYASAYTLNSAVGDLASGTKVISYRGTNSDGWNILPDIAFGWITDSTPQTSVPATCFK